MLRISHIFLKRTPGNNLLVAQEIVNLLERARIIDLELSNKYRHWQEIDALIDDTVDILNDNYEKTPDEGHLSAWLSMYRVNREICEEARRGMQNVCRVLEAQLKNDN